MKIVFQRKGSFAATVLQRLAFVASVGLLALSSQFSHAAPTGVASDNHTGGVDNSIDTNLEAGAELTDLSIRINLNPFVYRNKSNRRIQRRYSGYSNVPRRSFGNRSQYGSRYGKRYSKRYSNFNSYDRYGRPIYKEHRRKSGSNFGRNFRRR